MVDFFKKYEVIEKVASGGMAEIYKATLHGAEGFKKLVAVKMIRPELLVEPEFVEMFIKEATLAARLEHPNIVHVNEFDRMERIYYIVMEYVRGVDLKTAFSLHGRAWAPSLVFFLAQKILSALDHAHSLTDDLGAPLNLIHRDVTPHNILLSINGEVKLADFGIAKVRDAVSYTKSNMVRGKLNYLAPEQARGEAGGGIDARCDLFSLGLVLWELLTGERRYFPKEGQDLFTEIMEARFVPPSSVNPSLDPRIDDLLFSFLSPIKQQRFSSAREALEAIQGLFFADCSVQLARLVSQWYGQLHSANLDLDPTALIQGETFELSPGDLETREYTAEKHSTAWKRNSIAGALLERTRQITELHQETLLAREGKLNYTPEVTQTVQRPRERAQTQRTPLLVGLLLLGIALVAGLFFLGFSLRSRHGASSQLPSVREAPPKRAATADHSPRPVDQKQHKTIVVPAKLTVSRPMAHPKKAKSPHNTYQGKVILLKRKRGRGKAKPHETGLKSVQGWD